MICYSDFILSKNPWSYCRLDEPVGYNIYLDSSGNKNHLFSNEEGGVYSEVAVNRQPVNLLGDPFIGGIRPLLTNQVLKRDQFDFSIHETSLKHRIPVFKSDTIIYRRRNKIQNELDVKSMWLDILLKIEVPDHETIMKSWMPALNSYKGENYSIDHLYKIGDFTHNEALSGEQLFTSINQRIQLYTLNETFIIFGPIALIGSSGVHYHSNGNYLGTSYRLMIVSRYQKNNQFFNSVLWSRTLVSVDQVNDPAFPLSNEFHRFTFGLFNPTANALTFKISIDGGNEQNIAIELNEGTFGQFSHDIYSRIALMNNAVFSNFSVFFNQAFPSSSWLSASQEALTRVYRSPIAEDLSILSEYPMVERLPGGLINALNGFTLFGTNHRSVLNLSPGTGLLQARIEPTIPGIALNDLVKINQNKQSPFSGCWTVSQLETSWKLKIRPKTSTKIPATITVNTVNYDRSYRFLNSDFQVRVETKLLHYFSLGDMITLHHITTINQNHNWKVTEIDANGFNVEAQNLQDLYIMDDSCIIKKTPIGGGCWTKTFSNNVVGYGYKDIVAYKKNILIDDRDALFTNVYLAQSDNSSPSERLFIPKDIKNTLNKEKDRFPSKVAGDCHRLYWFISSKQNTVSHTSIIVFGEIMDYFNSEWCSVVIASTLNSKDHNTGFNYAFLYPSWSIDPNTGYLVCSSFKSHASDGLIKFIDEGLITVSQGYGDSGQHVYPINSPFISFNPI